MKSRMRESRTYGSGEEYTLRNVYLLDVCLEYEREKKYSEKGRIFVDIL